MGVSYTHLTEGERNQIYALMQAGKTKQEIAQMLQRNKSTIGREIQRNRGLRGYRPSQAQRKAKARQKIPRIKK